MIAALYVERGGCYFDLPGVDAWDEARDARFYDGPYPVVAHPPCKRWGRYWQGLPARDDLRLGDDGGCFEAALAAARRWGGVLEHPAYSHAWFAFRLVWPPNTGEWVSAGLGDPGWVCHVEQGHYGHPARKPTWLYVVGPTPRLRSGKSVQRLPPPSPGRPNYERARRNGIIGNMSSRARQRTPPAFRDLLLSIAAGAKP